MSLIKYKTNIKIRACIAAAAGEIKAGATFECSGVIQKIFSIMFNMMFNQIQLN